MISTQETVGFAVSFAEQLMLVSKTRRSARRADRRVALSTRAAEQARDDLEAAEGAYKALAKHETNLESYGDRPVICLAIPQDWAESTQAAEQRLAPGIAEVSGTSQATAECDDPDSWKSAEAESNDPKYELSGYA